MKCLRNALAGGVDMDASPLSRLKIGFLQV